METNTKLLLPFRNLFRQRTRAMIAVSAICTGVIALLLFWGFMEWTLWAIRETTIQFRTGHVQIMRSGYIERGVADPFAYLLPNEVSLMSQLEQHAAVKAIAPRLIFSGLISYGETTVAFVGEGIDPARERKFSRYSTIKAGKELEPDDVNSILLGQGLAASLAVKPGDSVILLANTGSGGINAVEARVSGLFTTASKSFDDLALRMPLALGQQLLRVSGAHKWIIMLEETDGTQAFLAQAKPLLSSQGGEFQTVPWYDLADLYNKTVKLFVSQMQVLGLIVGLLIVLGISNTMLMSVMDRTSEIGTLMALGLRRGQILRLFLAESLLLGLIGGGLGAALGYGLGELISWIGIPMPPAPGTTESYTAEIMVTWPLVVQGFLLSLTTTLIAGAIPAWRASRLKIVDALRAAR